MIKKYKIPFFNEKDIILKNIHITNNHPGINTMTNLIKNSGYYWDGFSKDIRILIKNCPICAKNHKVKKINMPIKQIIDDGPHFRLVADIWYLDDILKTNNNYQYVLDIKDHFSKFMCSYLLFNKTSSLVVSKIKLHLFNYGKCCIFQCDNGKEFKNKELKVFLENENIKLIFSRVKHPQTNGCIESSHKIVRKFLLNEYTIKKEKFDIDIAISEFIIFYNNSFNNVTKRVPNEIKDITDLEEIKEINLNIIKSM